jgi:hypothetical protein
VKIAANKILSNFSGTAEAYMIGIITPMPSKQYIENPMNDQKDVVLTSSIP